MEQGLKQMMDVPDLSQEDLEEMMKLLESYESSAQRLGPVPEELQELMNNVKRAKGQPTSDVETQNITPESGFVVKTADKEGRKVFINICHSKQVPAPGGWDNGSMPEACLQALENLARDAPGAAADAEALRFPLSCSELLEDADKSGQPCSTVDCIINSDIFKGAQQHRPLKALVVELALQQVSSKQKLELDPKFKLPKMAYKGAALPFAASSAGAEAQLLPDSKQLQVQLPYLSAQQWVQQLVDQAPHAFSKLPVAHSAYTELD
ncbi:hypothetical protein OEZ86_001438 [Tetradesmus obliquus]|nr:hypothetical protein OEZ86_001438 [Tetradesmus obliquus]